MPVYAVGAPLSQLVPLDQKRKALAANAAARRAQAKAQRLGHDEN